jgi:hypothetical protein
VSCLRWVSGLLGTKPVKQTWREASEDPGKEGGAGRTAVEEIALRRT